MPGKVDKRVVPERIYEPFENVAYTSNILVKWDLFQTLWYKVYENPKKKNASEASYVYIISGNGKNGNLASFLS